MGPITTLEPGNTSYLDRALLDTTGRLKLLDAVHYGAIPHNDLRVWCHKRARYGIPTTELIALLRAIIENTKAIEIGSAYGDFASLLGIPATDSKIQQRPDVKLYYTLAGQPVIDYPESVEQLEALQAVEKYKPETVIASWVTQWQSADEPPQGNASTEGVKERELLSKVETYVVVGNLDTHGTKSILLNPPSTHKVYTIQNPFIISRAARPENNCVLVWTRSERVQKFLENL